MPVSINSFISSFKKDLARPSRFDVNIVLPQALILQTNRQSLDLRCESTELPSRTLATAERKFGAAPIEKFAYQSTYNDLTMTFIVSGDMSEKVIFDAWMELINPTSNFNFTYKKNYVTDITINQYDLENNKTYSALLVNAFPVSVNQLDLDWNSESYHKLSVVFAYTYWTNVTENNILKNLGTQAISGLINTLTYKG